MLFNVIYLLPLFWLCCPLASGRTYLVANSVMLQNSLRAVNPGDTIQLRDGYYSGRFFAFRNGQPNAPIRLIGSQRAVISNQGGYGLYLTGRYWWLRGFSVRNCRVGIVLSGASNNLLDRLTVTSTDEEGILVQRLSTNNRIQYCLIQATGLRQPEYGYGIAIGSTTESDYDDYGNSYNPYNNLNRNYGNNYNGNFGNNFGNSFGSRYVDRSDGNVIFYNRIQTGTATEAIHAYEGTCCGYINNNYFDGRILQNNYGLSRISQCWVAVNGNQYRVENNWGRNTGGDGFRVWMIGGGDVYTNYAYSDSRTGSAYVANYSKPFGGQKNETPTQKAALQQRNIGNVASIYGDNDYYGGDYYGELPGGCDNVFRANRCEMNSYNGFCIRVVIQIRCRITVTTDNYVTGGLGLTNVPLTNL